MRYKGGLVMSSYGEMIWNFFQEGKIVPYEEELIEKLRDKYYEGIPLSIVLNSKCCCRTYCHHMAFQLTRGLDEFRLVRGNINIYPIGDRPNHSWVEKDGFVYDTTDGFKWEKNTYYELFDATIIEEYNENNYMDFWFYRNQLEKCEKVPKEQTAMMVELVEMLETEKQWINYECLMSEIAKFRKKEGITKKFPEEVMVKFKKFVLEELEKQKNL